MPELFIAEGVAVENRTGEKAVQHRGSYSLRRFYRRKPPEQSKPRPYVRPPGWAGTEQKPASRTRTSAPDESRGIHTPGRASMPERPSAPAATTNTGAC